MSTVVVAKKAGQVCIAADSLTSFGDLKLNSKYDAAHDKILRHDENYLGIVGSAAHQLVMESVLSSKKVAKHKIDIDFSSRLAIFETFRALHPVLKEKYFLNAKDEDDDPYESTQIDALIANPFGIFGVHSLREVTEYKRFWAIGSGAEYALGAMFAVYENAATAEEIAMAGVAAGAEFNNASAMPLSSYSVDLQQLKSVAGQD
ncbi:MAG TPA: MFS transporter [Gammaproteobacteria bacterium]|nr:MFS transporter [Gammaproteobacteria bacterium]